MTLSEFKKIKKRKDRILQKAEDEALDEGVDITSSQFLQLLEELKKKLLYEWGIDLAEYEEMEAKEGATISDKLDIEIKRDDARLNKILEEKDKKIEAQKKELDQKITTLYEDFKKKLAN